jgi:hypothetical protein
MKISSESENEINEMKAVSMAKSGENWNENENQRNENKAMA